MEVKSEQSEPQPFVKRERKGGDKRNLCQGGKGRMRPRRSIDKRNRCHGGPGRTNDQRRRQNERFIRWAFGKKATSCSRDELEKEGAAIQESLESHTKVAVMDLVQTNSGLWWLGYLELKVKKDKKWLQSTSHQKFHFCNSCPNQGEEMWRFILEQGEKVGDWELGNPVNATGEQYKTILYKRDIAAGHTDLQLLEKHKSCFVRYPWPREAIRAEIATGRVLTEEEIQGRWS